MNSQEDDSLPYVIAGIGSVVFLTCLPIFLYFALLFAANDIGGPLNLILIPCSNLIVAIVLTLVIFNPLSKLLDWLFQKINKDRQRRINPFLSSAVLLVFFLIVIIGVFSLATGIISENPFALRLLGTQNVDAVMTLLIRFLFLGGVPLLIGGATYWFILQTYRKILLNRQGLSDSQKAG